MELVIIVFPAAVFKVNDDLMDVKNVNLNLYNSILAKTAEGDGV